MSTFLKPLTLALGLLPSLALGVGLTTRVSTDASGVEANHYSSDAYITRNGRFVAFTSRASNLVNNDTNNRNDVFVKDLATGQISMASVNSQGQQGLDDSGKPWVSEDGKLVIFTSNAWNLVPNYSGLYQLYSHDLTTGETRNIPVPPHDFGSPASIFHYSVSGDGRLIAYAARANLANSPCQHESNIFVHDRQTAKTRCISHGDNSAANNFSDYPAISADGRFVSFYSFADNLIPGDSNGTGDIFVRKLGTGELTRVSVNSAGEQAVDTSPLGLGSLYSALSADGRYVAFTSLAANLVENDNNDKEDVFVHDRLNHTTRRVNVDSAGNEANGDSYGTPSISADGQTIAFRSSASNLVADDTNNHEDAFVHDLTTGITTRESVSVNGGQRARGGSLFANALSADGRWLAFFSYGNLLVPDDNNRKPDIFVRDRWLNSKKQADLSLNVSGPENAGANTLQSYLFTITNNGGVTADHADLVSLFPSSSKLRKMVAEQGECTVAAVSLCRLGSLAPGQAVTVKATVAINATTTINARINAAPIDGDLDNNNLNFTTVVQ